MPPATRPQKAPLMPKKVRPDAVTRKVTMAASRSLGSAAAFISAEPKAPSSANPATASMRIGGEAPMNAVAAPARRPKRI